MHNLKVSEKTGTALAASIIYAALCFPGAAQSQDKNARGNNTFMQQRIESAQSIIDQGNKYIRQARKLHEQSKLQIAEAKRLKGQAEKLEHIVPGTPQVQKLTPQQYKSALRTYQQDIEQFKTHANEYNAHLSKFQQMIGECHANDALYKEMAERYKLHVDRFHMPAILPPHICGALDLNQNEASSLSWMLRADRRRVAEAEQALRAEERKLAQNESMASSVAARLKSNAQRAEQEQQLAAEFGRLKKEYDLLEIEGKTLTASNKGQPGKVTRTSVSAKIK